MGAALFPLLFVPLTEQTGRVSGYFASYILFLIWLFPSAFAPNFAALVVTRFFGGGASSVSINIVGGTITDVWKGDKEWSIPMSIFGMTSIVGIALGLFIGRNSFGAFLPLASQSLYRNLGFQWASSLLGFIGLLLSSAPVMQLLKGPEMGKRSPFMSEASFTQDENTSSRSSWNVRRKSSVNV